MKAIIFFSYAHKDRPLVDKLRRHLLPLREQDLIEWHDRDISAGTEWEREINEHLNSAQIILLLVSPDFLNSDYCYSIEMKHVMEKHERGEVRVIPIILRPVYWERTPFGKLQVLPKDAKPVTMWANQDKAFSNVTESIYQVVQELRV